MSSGKKPTNNDIDLFRRSVGPVRKLEHDRVAPVNRPPSPRPRLPQAGHEPAPDDTFSDLYDAGRVASEDTLFFSRPGLQHRLLRRFRRGQLAIDDELDMHGMTASEARSAILDFITASREHGGRCVRIIHGKGYGSAHDAPVLKNRLNSWLRQHHEVLAFTSATPRDGGAGALYVLLRAQRD
ncbi:MAG: Smr/MutS family protein [Gammaproteobacteria bacterium]